MDIEALKTSIRADEGFVPYVYTDQVGAWTLGYGRMVDKRFGGGITRAEAEFLLSNDLQSCIMDLDTHFPTWFPVMSDARQRALTELRFQLGMPKLLEFVHMLSDFANANYNDAADELLNSALHQECPARTERIAAMIRAG